MAIAEKDRRSPYGRFLQGDHLSFTLNTVCADGTLSAQTYQASVSAIRGGGFVGKVLFFDGLPFVVKTTTSDALHDLLRRVNWGARDFPSQVREIQAQLDHLATDQISAVLSPITHGRYHAPRSYGYTLLANGFAQGVERLYGRPPRYDNGADEFKQFRASQQELTDIAYRLGLEQVGQIHPDNPFGMDNIWLKQNPNIWDWVDTLPAIPHNGWIWPLFYFKFHREIRKHFYPDSRQITFNRIHTDMFLQELRKHRDLFCEGDFRRIEERAEIYEGLWQKSRSQPEPPRNYRGLIAAAGWSAVDFGQSLVTGLAESISAPLRVVVDSNYRERVILSGVNRAFEAGVIGERELEDAHSLLQTASAEKGRGRFTTRLRDGTIFAALYGYYFGSSLALKVPELGIYAAFGLTDLMDRIVKLDLSPLTLQENWVERVLTVLTIFSGFRILGGLNSYLATKLVGFLSGKNLETAARVSIIPGIGPHLAVPAQICVDAGNKGEGIWHWTVRNLVAKISKINPTGGWGSELEGKTWNRVGKWLEGLAR